MSGYELIRFFTECFANITRGIGGIVRSPHFPLKYTINTTCEWNIHTRSPRSRILLQYPIFDMEGSRDGGKLATQLIQPYLRL